MNEVDGVRIDLSTQASGAWCLVRASNTTPVLTVLVEGRDDSGYEAARGIAADLLDWAGLDATALVNQAPVE